MTVTTIEQSKDLLKLGLNPDTADMYYPKVDEGLYAFCPYPKECDVFRKQESDIPAWSLSALLELMPKVMKGIPEKAAYRFVLKKSVYDAWQCNYEHPSFGELYSFPAQKTSLDAAYNMVVWLLENGHIRTESTSPIKNKEMIAGDYVSFETAKLLKEKGFAGNCFRWYSTLSGEIGEYDITERTRNSDRYIDAPTLATAMRWLREVHGVFICIAFCTYPAEKRVAWIPEINTFDSAFPDAYVERDTYEEAAEAAVNYCLVNLI